MKILKELTIDNTWRYVTRLSVAAACLFGVILSLLVIHSCNFYLTTATLRGTSQEVSLSLGLFRYAAANLDEEAESLEWKFRQSNECVSYETVSGGHALARTLSIMAPIFAFLTSVGIGWEILAPNQRYQKILIKLSSGGAFLWQLLSYLVFSWGTFCRKDFGFEKCSTATGGTLSLLTIALYGILFGIVLYLFQPRYELKRQALPAEDPLDRLEANETDVADQSPEWKDVLVNDGKPMRTMPSYNNFLSQRDLSLNTTKDTSCSTDMDVSMQRDMDAPFDHKATMEQDQGLGNNGEIFPCNASIIESEYSDDEVIVDVENGAPILETPLAVSSNDDASNGSLSLPSDEGQQKGTSLSDRNSKHVDEDMVSLDSTTRGESTGLPTSRSAISLSIEEEDVSKSNQVKKADNEKEEINKEKEAQDSAQEQEHNNSAFSNTLQVSKEEDDDASMNSSHSLPFDEGGKVLRDHQNNIIKKEDTMEQENDQDKEVMDVEIKLDSAGTEKSASLDPEASGNECKSESTINEDEANANEGVVAKDYVSELPAETCSTDQESSGTEPKLESMATSNILAGEVPESDIESPPTVQKELDDATALESATPSTMNNEVKNHEDLETDSESLPNEPMGNADDSPEFESTTISHEAVMKVEEPEAPFDPTDSKACATTATTPEPIILQDDSSKDLENENIPAVAEGEPQSPDVMLIPGDNNGDSESPGSSEEGMQPEDKSVGTAVPPTAASVGFAMTNFATGKVEEHQLDVNPPSNPNMKTEATLVPPAITKSLLAGPLPSSLATAEKPQAMDGEDLNASPEQHDSPTQPDASASMVSLEEDLEPVDPANIL